MTNRELYIQICRDHPGVPVFARPWWLDATGTNWDVAISRKGDMIRGIWAYPIEQKLGVTLIRNPFFTPYLGPSVFFPTDIKEANKDAFEYETIADLLQQLPPAQVWALAVQPELKQAGLFKRAGLQQSVQQTFLIDLAADEATLLSNMKESLRKNLRQAAPEVNIIADNSLLPQMYVYYNSMLTRKGKGSYVAQAQLQRLHDACVANNSGTLWVAKTGDTIHGILWHVWDGHTSYALSVAQNPDSDNYKAMSLLLWHAIKEAKKMSHTHFDFEGSMDEGVERFYRNFGGMRALYLILSKNTSRIWKLKQMLRG